MTARFRIGVDLGGTKIEAAAIDESGAVQTRRRVPTPAGDYAETVAAVAGQLAGSLYGAAGIPAAWIERLVWSERIRALGAALYDGRREP